MKQFLMFLHSDTLRFFKAFLMFVLFFNLKFFAQNSCSIEGKVVDSKTNEPIPYVSVYLSGTTLGVSTDISGEYKIIKAPKGRYSLIVSVIGYKDIVQKIYVPNDGKAQKHDFALDPNPIEMNQIEITEEHSAEWKDRLKIFRKYFLGKTDLSDECIIENQNELIFTQNESGAIEAKCYNPIVIINNALGYKIECSLTQFSCNDNTEEADIVYYPKFIEMTLANDDALRTWKENRKKENFGSLRRFLKSLINLTTENNEYTVYYTRDTNTKSPNAPIDLNNSVRYIQHRNNYELSFSAKRKRCLYVSNGKTGESSWIILPKSIALIDEEGVPIDPLMIQVIGDFAKKGIANLLPRFWENTIEEEKQ